MGSRAGDGGGSRLLTFFRELVDEAVEFLRYERRLAKKEKAGGSYQDHLEEAARKGDRTAAAVLESRPECPEQLEYLIAWSYELFGRSGFSMVGAAPLSPTVLKDWARLRGIGWLHPLEVEALFQFDAVLCAPETENEPRRVDEPKLTQRPRWPQRRN